MGNEDKGIKIPVFTKLDIFLKYEANSSDTLSALLAIELFPIQAVSSIMLLTCSLRVVKNVGISSIKSLKSSI